jgi:hypothetical protein
MPVTAQATPIKPKQAIIIITWISALFETKSP